MTELQALKVQLYFQLARRRCELTTTESDLITHLYADLTQDVSFSLVHELNKLNQLASTEV
jgi:hypothetical protein